MAAIQVQELIDAGVHYGHRASKWNPKMRPYIFGRHNLIHVIDLRETVKGLIRAQKFLQRVASQGSLVLFVGTKRQAQQTIVREAARCFMPCVSERWIGGTFTNFSVIRGRLARLRELERYLVTGEINAYSKKRRSTLIRELRKVRRNLSGMRTMNRLPGAVVVVDAKVDATALRESRKMGIPTIALTDTDSDPDLVDLIIPGNDDSIRSIDLVLGRLADAVLSGLNSLPKEQVDRMMGDYTKAHAGAGLEVEEVTAEAGAAATAAAAEGSAEKPAAEAVAAPVEAEAVSAPAETAS